MSYINVDLIMEYLRKEHLMEPLYQIFLLGSGLYFLYILGKQDFPIPYSMIILSIWFVLIISLKEWSSEVILEPFDNDIDIYN